MVILALLVACTGGGTTKQVSLGSPFVGGTQGLVISFQDFRSEVFDGNRDPFDIIVNLQNNGENLVKKENVKVSISGINPVEFSKTEQDLVKNAADDVIETRKDSQGSVLLGPPVFTEFVGLNHKGAIAGASAQFTIRADVCYLYRTRAASKLCIRNNLLTPPAGGICELNEDKPFFNSGAPVQIASFKETVRAKDKIGFTFEIKNVGQGSLFERNSVCDRTQRQKENRVYVTIATGLNGLSCTGLETTALGAEGFVTLYGGSKIVSCAQTVSTMSDFEQLVGVEVVYDYEEMIQNTLTVKSSGE